MGNSYTYYADLGNIELSEVGGKTVSWIKAMSLGEYKHPVFGDLKFTGDRVKRFAENVKNRVRGVDPDIDYDHKKDPAKGNKAAGWVKDSEARSDGLYLFVEWTPEATSAIKNKEYRYFSPEFTDEWADTSGNKFSDVLFGGALTNRPFLKDLLPINLSELNFGGNAPAPEKNEEEEVDLKALRALLGLAEDADEAAVTAKLTEQKTLAEAARLLSGGGNPPKPEPPKPDDKPVLKLSDEVKKLAEDNPTVKALVAHVEDQAARLAENDRRLRESTVVQKLSEFDNSKIVLTPVARDLVKEIMTDDGLPYALSEKIWKLLGLMKTSQAVLVELGERAGAGVRYGREKSAEARFGELVTEAMKDGKTDYPTALENVAREHPDLYNQYRDESFAFKE